MLPKTALDVDLSAKDNERTTFMERRKMKKKGFTLVELLVVIAIIAMLLAILMPALGKVRQLAQRIMCSTNLAGLGKAMLTYSNDDKYESFPVGGASGAYWAKGTGGKAGTNCFTWQAPTGQEGTTTHSPHYATLSSSLYLLVKIADTTPDQFICPGSDNKKFELSNFTFPTGSTYSNLSFTDVWDFGAVKDAKPSFTMGKGHNTYSYQAPIPLYSGTASGSVYPITTTSNPAKAVMADRNPYWTATGVAKPVATGAPLLYVWDTSNNKPHQASLANGNTFYHQKDGQNVLYADLHAKFEKSANCGVQQDNIYTYWGYSSYPTSAASTDVERIRQCGKGAQAGASDALGQQFEGGDPQALSNLGESGATSGTANGPMNEEDNYLISDFDNY
jgi:prepilin-type N-terminal cleavage/methylation domain-containing protein